jgi:apolipoprotein N-acyltransferase
MRTEYPVTTIQQRSAAQPYPQIAEPRLPGAVRLPWPCLLPALATGGLLWLCYFPVAWGWLGWVALVPLLSLVRTEARPRRIYLSAWAAGLAFFVPALYWMGVAGTWMIAAWVALALYISLYLPAAIWLLRRLDRGTPLPLALTLPLVWTSLEFLRAHLISGFPWYFLAHTQHDFLALIQVSDLAGAYAVTFLVAAVNGIVFELLYRWRRFRSWLALPLAAPTGGLARLIMATAMVLLLVGGLLGYGVWRLNEAKFTPGPRVVLLQGNIKQSLRNDAATPQGSAGAKEIIRKSYDDLCKRSTVLAPRPDLIVWPETSYVEHEWVDLAAQVPRNRLPAKFRKKIQEIQAKVLAVGPASGTNVLLGLEPYILDPGDRNPRRYNSALLVQADGKAVSRYDKIHRVPFGEFVPFRDELPFMNLFNAYGYDFSVSPGESFVRLPLGKYHFCVLICYEDTDPTLARRYAVAGEDGPAADFLVNISNDGWFDGSSEHDEHLAICRFRAIESRRPVVRSVNMGISAVIDGNGRVLHPELISAQDDMKLWEIKDPCSGPGLPVSAWHRFKKVEGVLNATIPLDNRTSLYARWGDWLPWTCWLGVAAALAGAWYRRLRCRQVAARPV